MRIGIDIRAIGRQRTGDESYTLGLVKELEKVDQKNEYFLYTDTNRVSDLEKIKKKLSLVNKNFKVISVLPAHKFLWTFFSLPRHLKRNPVDVLHVQYITPARLPKGVKLVTTIHDISFARYPQLISWKDLLFLKLLIPASLKRADRIIAVSEFTKKEIIDYYKISADRIEVVNNVISQSVKVQSTEFQCDEVRRKYKLFNPFLFYIGTLQPRKNIPFLIRSFFELKQKFAGEEKIDALDLVIGGNQLGHNYDQKIDVELGKIRTGYPQIAEKIKLIGFVEDNDMAALFAAAEAFVFPSLYEGFGIPLLEAMAQGVPVVCSISSCHREVVGDAALFYQENKPEELISQLYLLLNDVQLKARLIEAGRKRVEFFANINTGEKTKKVYEKLVFQKAE